MPASAFSHAVVGCTLATLAPASVSPGRLALVLAAAAALPDLDVIAFSLGIPYGDPLGHRGFSHSLLFAALLAPTLALLAGARPRGATRPFLAVVGIGFLAVASHGLLDALTDAGLGVGFLVPFSGDRFFFPWRPLMTSPLGVGTFFTQRGYEILASESTRVIAPALVWGAAVIVLRRRARSSAR